MIRGWSGWNDIILFSWCLTRLYAIVIFDAYIIMDGNLGTQNRIVLILSLTEGTDVVVNLIADDVWESGGELTGALIDKVESWYWLCL